MVQSKNEDIIAYLPIAQRAWDMECELWSETSKRLASAMTSLVTVDHVNFNTSQLPKVKAICGRYRWMAWRSQRGIRAKRAIPKMHARDKKARIARATILIRELNELMKEDDNAESAMRCGDHSTLDVESI